MFPPLKESILLLKNSLIYLTSINRSRISNYKIIRNVKKFKCPSDSDNLGKQSQKTWNFKPSKHIAA